MLETFITQVMERVLYAQVVMTGGMALVRMRMSE